MAHQTMEVIGQLACQRQLVEEALVSPYLAEQNRLTRLCCSSPNHVSRHVRQITRMDGNCFCPNPNLPQKQRTWLAVLILGGFSESKTMIPFGSGQGPQKPSLHLS